MNRCGLIIQEKLVHLKIKKAVRVTERWLSIPFSHAKYKVATYEALLILTKSVSQVECLSSNLLLAEGAHRLDKGMVMQPMRGP